MTRVCWVEDLFEDVTYKTLAKAGYARAYTWSCWTRSMALAWPTAHLLMFGARATAATGRAAAAWSTPCWPTTWPPRLLLLMCWSPAQVQRLPRIASAEALVVLAHQERAARYHLNQVSTRATQAGDGWTLSGTKSVVPAGDEAEAFIVPAGVSGSDGDAAGIALFLVDRAAAGVSVRGYPTQDGARAAELTLAGSPATLITLDGLAALEQGVDVGIAAVCAEAVGLMDATVAITVDYMNTRKQFKTPLSGFQALRHRIADVKMQLELARSMSYYASLKLGEPAAQRRRAISQRTRAIAVRAEHHVQRPVQCAPAQYHG